MRTQFQTANEYFFHACLRECESEFACNLSCPIKLALPAGPPVLLMAFDGAMKKAQICLNGS